MVKIKSKKVWVTLAVALLSGAIQAKLNPQEEQIIGLAIEGIKPTEIKQQLNNVDQKMINDALKNAEPYLKLFHQSRVQSIYVFVQILDLTLQGKNNKEIVAYFKKNNLVISEDVIELIQGFYTSILSKYNTSAQQEKKTEPIVEPKKQQVVTSGNNQPAQEEELLIENPRYTLADYVGKLPEELTIIIDKLRHPEKYPGDPVKGLLFYGPPGTGKTFLAEVIAHEIDALIKITSATEFLNKYVGVGAENLRKLFAACEKYGDEHNKKIVIFIDEFDAIAGSRDADSSAERINRDLVNQLLALLNKEYRNLIFIVATNDQDHIDPALKRSGRITHHIKFENPDKKARNDLIKHYIEKFFYAKNKPISLSEREISRLANTTADLSPADLRQLVTDAGAHSTFAGKVPDYVDFKKTVQKIHAKKMDEAFDKLKKNKNLAASSAA